MPSASMSGMRLCGSNPPGLPSLYSIVSLDDALPRADRADPADAALAVADRVLLDDEPLLAVLALDDPRRAVAELRIDVFVPQIQRLEDVPVGVDDVVSATHNPAPFRVDGETRKPNARLVCSERYAWSRGLSSPTGIIRGSDLGIFEPTITNCIDCCRWLHLQQICSKTSRIS